MDVGALKALLSASGYDVRFRRDAWVECLLLAGRETFVGRGADDDAALLAAVDAAFPSSLAKALLVQALGAPVASAPRPAPPKPAVGHRAVERSAPPLVDKTSSRPARNDHQRAVDELHVLNERVRDSREELGLCTSERQRLAILAWICEARAHTDVFPGDEKIRDEVAQVSRQLTEIGKAFWPGSVTALQLQMQPKDLPRHLLGGTAATWTSAAELAERALHSMEHADERRGHDEHGWADYAYTQPPPADADATLAELVAELERYGGSIERYAEPRDASQKPDEERFLRWVRTLRWLRGTHVDPNQWARATGRLRWWAGRRDPNLTPHGKELDGGFVPARPWAELLHRPGAPSPTNGPPAKLVTQARERCAGKRIVIVSHRRDPELQRRVEGALQGASIDWAVSEPKRLEALAQTIGDYDLVLGALGLQAPRPDCALARACRVADTPYLRVNRGRPVACLRAIARVGA